MQMPKTVYLVSLGCSKNRVDSEVLLGILNANGIRPVTSPVKAELICVNTCGFIGPAKEESIDTIFEMARFKQTGKCRLLMVTGCLSQRYGKEMRDEMPEVDVFLGTFEYPRVMEAIRGALGGARPLWTEEYARFFEAPRLLTGGGFSAYVKISDGCSNRCAFCAIPLIRGSYHSRSREDVLKECRDLMGRGVSEITLIAQDTSRYGNDLGGGKLLLAELLHDISALDGLHWLRVLYCYPDTVNEPLLDAIAGLPKVAPYLDLPLQHIDGGILRAMRRRGTPDEIRALMRACRERNILVRTTMIVGFPGETEEQFGELLDFVREARFGRLGAFTYSPEEGTAAAEMPDQIPEEIKEERLDRLMMLQQGISLEENEKRVGSTCEVLAEGMKDGMCIGRSLLEAPEVDGTVSFRADRPPKPGQYVNVRLTGADAYDLSGEMIE